MDNELKGIELDMLENLKSQKNYCEDVAAKISDNVSFSFDYFVLKNVCRLLVIAITSLEYLIQRGD